MEGLLSGRTKVAAVFGYPVEHSVSPRMHNAAFRELGLDYIYVPFNVHPDCLEGAVNSVRALGLVGVNLTIPHKGPVLEFLDWVSPEAAAIGSVNTIHNKDGKLKGYSTDGEGFLRSLEAGGKSPEGSRAVVLGAGGSARAVAHALAAHGSEVAVVNRTAARAVELAAELNAALGAERVRAVPRDSTEAQEVVAGADLLVNCTSVGMYPNVDAQPILSDWLHDRLFVFDSVYNPLKTRLLQAAAAAGSCVMEGVKMLVFQGAIAFEIWTGQTAPVQTMERAVLEGLEESA